MRRSVGALILTVWVYPQPALAGMPGVTISDLVRLRLQTLSFFLLVLLVCTWSVRGIWNWLRRDFPRLPRLSFPRALGLVALWGTLFVLVLTMISGARELMTPGAWKKQGLTYQLAADPAPRAAPEQALEAARRNKLDTLRRALWRFAADHNERFPDSDQDPGVPAETWESVDPSGMHYLYNPKGKPDVGSAVLAYEPGLFGATRLVLFTDGTIRPMSVGEIRAALERSKP